MSPREVTVILYLKLKFIGKIKLCFAPSGYLSSQLPPVLQTKWISGVNYLQKVKTKR